MTPMSRWFWVWLLVTAYLPEQFKPVWVAALRLIEKARGLLHVLKIVKRVAYILVAIWLTFRLLSGQLEPAAFLDNLCINLLASWLQIPISH